MLAQLLTLASPSRKRRAPSTPLSTTPVKRVREKVKEGALFENEAEWALPCRALCDAVISVSAARDEETEKSALLELQELLDGPARVGIQFSPSPDDEKATGTPLYLAAWLDCHKAAEKLLQAGASMVLPYKGITPLQAAHTHGTEKTLNVFYGRVKRLEQPPDLRRPLVQRAWSHHNADGTAEPRLHRVTETEEEEVFDLPRLVAAELAQSEGWAHAPTHTRARSSSR